MTTPTILSTNSTTANRGNVRQSVCGEVFARADSVSVPATTAAGVNIGLMPIFKGERVLDLLIDSADLDTGTAITFDIGVLYIDSALTASEDQDGLIVGSTIPQADTGILRYPSVILSGAGRTGALGINFIAAGDGWITATVRDSGAGGTTTTGTVVTRAMLDYGANTAA